MVNIKKLIASFRYAVYGVKAAFKKEQSFRIQLVVALIVFGLAFIFQLSYLEKAILALSCGLVLGLKPICWLQRAF